MSDHDTDLHSFLRERLGDQDLDPEQAEALAGELAERAELWRHLVRHSDQERIYTELYRDHHLDVVALVLDDRRGDGNRLVEDLFNDL